MRIDHRFYARRLLSALTRKAKTVSRSAYPLRVERLESRDTPTPVPTVTGLAANQDVFLGENAGYSFTFANTGTTTGYGPYLVVAVDTSGVDGAGGAPFDGLASPSAPPVVTSTGLTLTPLANLPYSATFTNPFTGATEAAPTGGFGANDRLYVYQLPFISMTPGQSTGVTITAPLSGFADLGTTLPIAVKPMFRDDNATAPFNVTTGAQANTVVNPILYTLTKTYLGPEDETATGPNYTRRYRLDVDIAPGQTLDNLRLTDLLPNTMQIVARNATNVFASTRTGGLGTNALVLGNLSGTAAVGTPGGTLVYNFGSVVGGAGVDARFEFDFFVPRDTTTGNEILPQPTPPGPNPAGGTDRFSGTDATRSSVNTVSSVADWDPTDPRDGIQSVNKAAADNGPHTLEEHSVAVQKGVTPTDLSGNPLPTNPDLGVPVIRPGFTLLRYDIDFQVSDYYAVNNLFLDDVLGDGQRLYLASGFAPTLTVNNAWQFAGGGTRAAATSGAFGGANTIDYERRYSLSGNTDRTPSNGIEGYAEAGASGGAFNLLAAGATASGSTFLRFNVSQELIARGLSGLLVGGQIANGGGNPQNATTSPFGAATGRVTFYALVKPEFADDFPSGDRSVDQGDRLTNGVPLIQGSHLSPLDLSDGTPTALGTTGTDDSGTSVSIPYGTREKMIYAINGQTIPAQGPTDRVNVQAGDRVTYRLTYTLPTSSFENLQLIDFPPLPVMPVAGAYTFVRNPAAYAFLPGTVGVYDPAGSSSVDDTYFATFDPGSTGGRNPVVTSDTVTNSVTMDFGDQEDPQQRFTTISLLVTFQVSNDPFAADLPLTNQLRVNEDSTNQASVTVEAIRQFELVVPDLAIRKGVVGFNTTGRTLGGVGFTAPGTAPSFTVGGTAPSGTNAVNNVTQANAVGGANGGLADNIDAGDTVRFAIVAQNSGGGDAFDVVIQDTIQAAFDRTTFANLRVYRGDGTLLTPATDYVSTYNPLTGALQITLTDNYTAGNVGGAAQDARNGSLSRGDSDAGPITNGSNTIVVLYDVTLANAVAPNQTITNTAVVASFATSEGGPDVTDPAVIPGATDPSDTANVVVALPLVSKTLVGTELTAPGNNAANQATIGELVTYTVTVTIPEGGTPGAVLVDTLDAGLAFVDVTAVTASGALGFAGGGLPTAGTAPANTAITNGGRTITFTLGAITNGDADNAAAETVTITYRAVLLNTLPNQSGQTRTNSADFNWTNNAATLPAVPAGRASTPTGGLTGTATPVTIVEPTLTAVKDVAVQSAGTGPYSAFGQQVRADAGDNIRYRVTFANPAAGSTTAHDVTLSDQLPVGAFAGPFPFGTSPVSVTVVGSGQVRRNGAPHTLGVSDFTINGSGLLQLNPSNNYDIDPDVTITVDVQGTNFLGTTGSLVSNVADVRWTSLDGTPGQRSVYNTSSTERTGEDGEIGSGALNDYRDTDDAVIESPPVVRKTVVGSGDSGTTPAAAHPVAGGTADRLAVGEVVRYRLFVSIPETNGGTPIRLFTVQDRLPAGLRFLNDGSARFAFISTGGAAVSSATSGSVVGLTGGGLSGSTALLLSLPSSSLTGTFGDSNIAPALTGAGAGDPAVYASGDDVFFRFGDLSNTDNDTDAEYAVIEFNALVENIPANQAGTTLDNAFGVLADTNTDGTPGYIDVVADANGDGLGTGEATVAANDPANNGSGTAALSNAASVTVVEPNAQINKEVIATTGGTVTYRLTVTNTGANSSRANNVRVFDQLDGVNLTLNGTPSVTLGGGATGPTNNTAGNLVDFTVDALPVGGTIVITYTASVLTTPTGTATTNNTANATFTSLTGDNGDTLAALGTSAAALGTPGTATGERTGADGVGGALNDYADDDTERLGSLGDRVYYDADADGVQDAGEPGVVGVPVTVRWAGPNGTFNDGDDGVITVNTGGNGVWTVPGLPVGPGQLYRVSVPTTFSGMALTDARDNGGAANTNPDGLGAGVSAIALTGADAGTTNNRIQDFGYRGTASLGDRVYLDADGDGVQDANGLEPGLPGVTVTLEWAGANGVLGDADDLTFTTVSTPAAGTAPNYLFPNLPSGDFRVTVSAAGGSGGVPDNTALTDGVDDGVLTAAPSVTTTLTTGQVRTDQDFGYRGTASLGDRVYYDADADGVQDAGEPGLPGVGVTLVWAGPNGTLGDADDVTFTTTTDAAGNYLFPNLPVNGASDDFRVTVTPPAVAPTLTDSLDDAAVSATNPVTVPLGATQTRTDVDFGFRGTASLGDFVWEDRNANGRQDGGEPGINGVTVELYYDANTNGAFEPGELAAPLLTTTTAGGGAYSFPNLAAGNYRVRFGSSDGATTYARTSADSPVATDTTDSDANAATGFTGDYTLALGGSNVTVDAGLYRPVSLGDRVYLDADADGVQDAGEPGLAGVGVTVTWHGPDGVLGGGDDQTFTATTGTNGLWSVTNLPPGTFTVQTTPPPASGLNTLTDSLDDGTLTASSPVVVSTPSGANRTDVDFGYRGTASLGDRVWWDVDGDGMQDAGEPGLPGLPVTLTWFGTDGAPGGGDDLVLTTTTGADGAYLFTSLPAGTFRVDVSAAGTNLTPTFDPDGTGTPNSATTTLTAGQARTDVDFGLVGNASVGDRVYVDQNRDGNQQPTEPGIPNATLRITSVGVDGALGTADDFSFTAATTATGQYLFTGLPVFGGGDDVRVEVTSLPAVGLTFTDSLDDGVVNPVNPVVVPVTDSGANQNRRDVDFGYDGLGSLSGTVYQDVNNNGVLDRGDAGIPGVVVTLTGTDQFGNPVLDPATGRPYQVTTDANGNYLFATVVPGTYAVTETQPAAYLDNPDTAGSNGGVVADDVVSAIPIGPNQAATGYNFGEILPASVGGSVYEDRNRNGVRDPFEPGIPGVTVTLTGTDDRGPVTRPLTTDANGFFLFDRLRPGTYTLTETQPPAFAQSGNAVGTAGGTEPRRDVIATIVLAQGVAATSYTFGEVRIPPPAVPVSPAPPVEPTKQQFLASTRLPIPPTTPTFAALGSVDPNRPVQFLATADGPGGRYVRVFDLTAGTERFRFEPFPGFAGGMQAAVGDVTGDGIPDVVVGAGAGGAPHVKVFDGGTGAEVGSFLAFEPVFRGGVSVTTGDFNGDGRADVAVGAGAGGGPRVRVLSAGDPNVVLSDFWGIDDLAFRGGVRLAAGDLNADGRVDLAAAAGSGGGPRVAAYSGQSVAAGLPLRLFNDFVAFEPQLRNGTHVAVADVDGDGFGDLIAGAGEGGAPRVSAFSGQALLSNSYVRVADLFAFDPATDGGVRVAARDLDADGRAEIVAAAGPRSQPYVRFLDPRTPRLIDEFAAGWTNSLSGVYVG